MTNKKIKQKGGSNIIDASIDLIKSMKALGDSIFYEIAAITNIKNDIDNAATPSQGTPNVMSGPPTFNQPNLAYIPNR